MPIKWPFRRAVTDTPPAAAASVENIHVSLAQMRTALNSLPMGVIIVDETGKEWWRNRTAHELLDAAEDVAAVSEKVRGMLRRAVRGDTEHSQLHLDGPPPRSVEMRAVPTMNAGGLVILEDVTLRILTDSVRTDFVANISHELKTPVSALSLLAETILGEIAGTSQEEDLAPLSQRMVSEAQRMAGTIDDLLELASIEFGGAADSDPVKISEVVAESLARVLPLARSKNISFSSAGEDSLVVEGDMHQLVSAVTNLVENAVKYSDPGGSVLVSTAVEGNSCSLSVTDRGIGIANGHLDRIFERFYRADPGRARETGGTGLGLAIVRHIASNHGGEVTVTSTEGEGTTFVLHIPVSRR